MAEELTSRLRNFEDELNNQREKFQSYLNQIKDKSSNTDIDFTTGKISAYLEARDLLYEHFPESKTEQGQGAQSK